MPILLFLLFIAFRIGLILLAAWLMTIGVPLVLADPDHFVGWLNILVALGVALGSSRVDSK